MLLLTFLYTKADGSSSTRVISPHITPSAMYAGTDISELSGEEVIKYAQAMNILLDEHAVRIAELNEAFGVSNKYRQFKAEGVSDIKREFI